MTTPGRGVAVLLASLYGKHGHTGHCAREPSVSPANPQGAYDELDWQQSSPIQVAGLLREDSFYQICEVHDSSRFKVVKDKCVQEYIPDIKTEPIPKVR